jgi:TRAP-type mannitol/chloroaromatic compound transport system permease large subunit
VGVALVAVGLVAAVEAAALMMAGALVQRLMNGRVRVSLVREVRNIDELRMRRAMNCFYTSVRRTKSEVEDRGKPISVYLWLG